MGIALTILIVLAVLGFLFGLNRSQARFIIRIRQGRVQCSQGVVTEAFLREIAEISDEFDIRDGEIRGVPQGRRILLRFSRSFPHPAQQRLRNWWFNCS